MAHPPTLRTREPSQGDINLAALAAQTTTSMRSWLIEPMLENTANLTLSVSVLLPSQVYAPTSSWRWPRSIPLSHGGFGLSVGPSWVGVVLAVHRTQTAYGRR